MFDSHRRLGFTMIELLIALGIFLVLAAAVFPFYGRNLSWPQLAVTTQVLVGDLRSARQSSVARWHAVAHGVYFYADPVGDDHYVIYRGPSYAAREPSADRLVALPATLALTVNLPDPDLNFSPGDGAPNATGTVLLADLSVADNRSITITRFGSVLLD